MTGGTQDEWGPYLDSLEEWVRRVRDALGTGSPPLPPLLPSTPVPAELVLRAQLLVEGMSQVESEGQAVRARMQRERAYGAA
jgi:hypothetical protein